MPQMDFGMIQLDVNKFKDIVLKHYVHLIKDF